jgi:hypothetical protein
VLEESMAASQFNMEWNEAVFAAFKQQPQIGNVMLDFGRNDRAQHQLFREISYYVSGLHQQIEQQQQEIVQLQNQQQQNATLPTNNKKRKLDDGGAGPSTQQNGSSSVVISQPVAVFECKDVSVQIPARKKLKLSLVRDAQDTHRAEVRLLNPNTNDLEYHLPVSQIEDVFTMPVPDKQARQAYFAITPKAEAISADGTPPDQILFTLAETSPPSAATSSGGAISEDETYVSAMQSAFAALIAPYGKRIITPDEAEFASAKPQSHRKGEKGYHVSAHRGSKEGMHTHFISSMIYMLMLS